MILHSLHASLNHPNVVIRSPDTDVFLIAMSIVAKVENTNIVSIYFATGTQNKKYIIDVTKIAQHWGSQMAQSMIGFHAFTGNHISLH